MVRNTAKPVITRSTDTDNNNLYRRTQSLRQRVFQLTSLIWILVLQLVLAGVSHAREPVSAVKYPEKITPEMLLGKQLFFDPILSEDRKTTCASCHQFSHGGSFPDATTLMYNGQPSRYNSSSVFNLSANYILGWEGQFSSIAQQIDALVTKKTVMGLSWNEITARLQQHSEYRQRFDIIYPEGITRQTVMHAIATYETALTTPSPFDAFQQGDNGAISEDAKLGYELFKRYGCISCHQGQNIGGNLLQKIGVIEPYTYDPNDRSQASLGRYNTTHNEADIQVFRVPSLRNVADTPPYFHDGSVSTLEEAVSLMSKHQLGREIPSSDITLIVAFLQSLSGSPHPTLIP